MGLRSAQCRQRLTNRLHFGTHPKNASLRIPRPAEEVRKGFYKMALGPVLLAPVMLCPVTASAYVG